MGKRIGYLERIERVYDRIGRERLRGKLMDAVWECGGVEV